MVKREVFLFVIILAGMAIAAQQGGREASLYSPSAAAILSRVGMDGYAADPYSAHTVEVTITFLQAALELDDQLGSAREDLLKVSASGMAHPKDYSRPVMNAMRRYVDQQAYLSVVNHAVAYLLGRQNTRMDREALLSTLTQMYSDRNPVLASELKTQLSLLMMERAATKTAFQQLTAAYQMDPYNSLAFAKLVELSVASGQTPANAVLVQQLRRAVEANPLNLPVAMAYADILRQVQLYEPAQKAYGYTAELYAYLNSSQSIPVDIILPWSLCAFQSEWTRGKCLILADQIQADGKYDLSLEAVAGLAMIRMGDTENGRQRLQKAMQKASRLAKQTAGDETIVPEQLCWFAAFVLLESEQALAWGHEAFAQHPESPQTRALFAYALTLNGQSDLATEYLENADETDPVVLFTRAEILLQEEKKTEALSLFRKIIELGPETLIAFRADQRLKENDSEYLSAIASSEILSFLNREFGTEVVPAFAPISKMLKAKLNMNGSEYLYGRDLQANVTIENIGTGNLIISEMSMFTGRIRIDAEVQGDIRQYIPALVDTTIRPGRVLKPGQHAVSSFNLMRGSLRNLLRTYPQASVEVRFTLWLDPVEDSLGIVSNRWSQLEPVRYTIRRQGIELTRDFLMQRLDGVAHGKEGQKYRAAELFTGLLAEQHAAGQGDVSYRFARAEPQLLTDAIRRLLADKDWMIRMQTLATLADVSLPIDYSLVSSVSENLSHEKWPVRMLALTILSAQESKNFQSVLEWTARNDTHPLNRQMGAALGGFEMPVRQAEPGVLPKTETNIKM